MSAEVTFNNTPVTAIFDGGSGVTLISEEFLSTVNVQASKLPWHGGEVTGADNEPLHIVRTTKGKLEVGGSVGKEIDALVVRRFRYNLLLGNDTLHALGVKIDW
jgi:hypothetical protein